MPSDAEDPDPAGRALPINAVERNTGLSKDTLRVWERRYGFPLPLRDAHGERLYPADQVDKLRVLKRLLDAGHRPGRLVRLPLDELQRLCEPAARAAADAAPANEATADVYDMLALLRAHRLDSLRHALSLALARLGLARFIDEWLLPLNTLIGDAWMRGQIAIFQEHAYTELQHTLVRAALAKLPAPEWEAARPRMLLSTLPGELHTQGLMLAEAFLGFEQAPCRSLGAQTPLWDVVQATRAYEADIVVLGVSGCMGPNPVLDGLQELRRKLPPEVALWAGGSAPVLQRRPVEGVQVLPTLDRLRSGVRAWRAARGL